LITARERCSQVFIYDTEGAFELETSSFQAFYQNWLDFKFGYRTIPKRVGRVEKNSKQITFSL